MKKPAIYFSPYLGQLVTSLTLTKHQLILVILHGGSNGFKWTALQLPKELLAGPEIPFATSTGKKNFLETPLVVGDVITGQYTEIVACTQEKNCVGYPDKSSINLFRVWYGCTEILLRSNIMEQSK